MTIVRSFYNGFSNFTFYGDEGAGTSGSGTATGAGGGTGGGSAPPPKSFTKEEVDKMLEQERKVNTDRNRKVLEELETLKTNNNLTSQEKETLSSRIEELQNTLLTKEEQAEKEKQKLEKRFKDEQEKVSKERDVWAERFKSSTINAELVSAASTGKAVNPEQVLALLLPKANLMEDKADDGSVGFKVRIKYPSEKDGKPINLDLSPSEAIDRMREDEKYQNLFQDTLKGGAGMGTNTPKTLKNLQGMSVEEYVKLRQTNGPGGGFSR